MSADERTRLELAHRLTDLFGEELAAYLMEILPPFSWHEVATKRDLGELEARLRERFDQRIDGLDAKMDLQFGALESRIDERTNVFRAEARRAPEGDGGRVRAASSSRTRAR